MGKTETALKNRRRVPKRLASIAVGLMLGAGGCATTPDPLTMLPAEVEGWKAAGQDRLYTAETLYRYIDGGAEVYRAFDVQRVFARRYVKPGSPDILADVFEMASPGDAFGVYHHNLRKGQDVGVGQESEYLAGSLAFWKGRYFVSIMPFEETPSVARTVRTLATVIDRTIRESGSPPDLVCLLPQSNRIAGSLRYFHTHTSLNAYYFLADSNILELNMETEGVLARYQAEERSHAATHSLLLMVVRYPSSERAHGAYVSFREAYLPDADAEGIALTENGRWAGAVVKGRHLIIGLDAYSREQLCSATVALLTALEDAGLSEKN